ncbi:hypothetical protein SBA3_1210033 [Candidatus Sulfopaludibacter sp. SbA3]|nr:hypothetical protein SBA3_1210033 [Candidatus Sulfopaludibacter sp. SbA3]
MRDGSVSFSTDVYSLGVILSEIINGCKTTGSDLDVLCLKAKHPESGARYQSVEALIRDIDHLLKGEPLEARPDSLTYRLGKFVTRNRAAVLAAGMSAALVAALVVFFTVRLARERDRANQEAAVVTAMNRFLSDDLLGRSDPFKSGKAQESFADAVNRASSHIDAQFSAEPLVAARLHHTIALAFDNRSDYPPARREYARAFDLFRKAEGPQSQDAILTHLELAAMEARSYEGGSLALAKSLLKGAEADVARVARPREDLRAALLSTRGVVALIDNDPRSANQSFQAALRVAQASASFDAAALRRIKRTLAFSYIRLGDGARAESLFRELIAELSRTGSPDAPDTLQARINFTQSLFIQGKYAAAIEEANRIYPALVQRFGEDHETVMTVLGTRAASEGSLAMWDEAIRDDLTIYRLARRKQGPVSFFSLGILSDAALSQCRAGRLAEGEANAREAYDASKKAFGARAGITGGCSYALAVCLIGTNKLGEASDLLRDIDAVAVRQLTGDSAVDAGIALAQGEIAARRGDYAVAKNYAETAARVFDLPNAAVPDKQSLRELRAAIDAGLRH